MANKAVFIDRDGTMALDVHYCSRSEDFTLFPETAKAVKLLNENGFKVIVITNQSGISRGYFTEETLSKIHEKMVDLLAKEGAHLDGIYYCPHHPDDNCDCRKPKTKLILQAARDFDINLSLSWMIGDGLTDVQAGEKVGCKTILLGRVKCELCHFIEEQDARPDAIAPNLLSATQIVVLED